MIPKSILLLLFALFFGHNSHACLNYFYGVDKDGHLHLTEDYQRKFNTNFNLRLNETRLKKLEKQLTKEKDYRLLSDYAVLLLNVGKTELATQILEKLSLKFPNEYQIAANLGTAYELSGQVELALKYIKRGLELNPDSHGGSEWVHVKVLEAKLNLKRDKNYLNQYSVLGLTDAKKRDSLVRQQIDIQVRERFPFCPGPDPIMASLLIDLADCYANTESIEYAKALYTLAKNYYGAGSDLVDAKISEMRRLNARYINLHPEQQPSFEGMNNRVGGIAYKKLLGNNNESNYRIQWDRIELNQEVLLGLIDYDQIPEPEPAPEGPSDSINSTKTPILAQDKEPKQEKEDNYVLYYLVIGFFVVLVFGFFFLRKGKKNGR